MIQVKALFARGLSASLETQRSTTSNWFFIRNSFKTRSKIKSHFRLVAFKLVPLCPVPRRDFYSRTFFNLLKCVICLSCFKCVKVKVLPGASLQASAVSLFLFSSALDWNWKSRERGARPHGSAFSRSGRPFSNHSLLFKARRGRRGESSVRRCLATSVIVKNKPNSVITTCLYDLFLRLCELAAAFPHISLDK